jgi:hypothetical protein
VKRALPITTSGWGRPRAAALVADWNSSVRSQTCNLPRRCYRPFQQYFEHAGTRLRRVTLKDFVFLPAFQGTGLKQRAIPLSQGDAPTSPGPGWNETLRLKRLILLFALSICAGCRYSAAPYYGQLLVADERGISLVSLPSTDRTLLLPTPKSHIVYGHPTMVAPGVLIFSSTQRLVRFNLRTRELVDLGEGIWPTYVPEHHLLFFWQSREGSAQPTNRTILVRSLNDPANEKVVATFSDIWISRIVQISSDEVTFYGAGGRVWKYSIASSTLSPTAVERCLPMAWRSKTGQLICQDVHSHEIYLSYLNGRATRVPVTSDDVLDYSPNYDTIIYSAAYGSSWQLQVGWAIVAYNFRDHRTVRLAWSRPGATAILLDNEGNQL